MSNLHTIETDTTINTLFLAKYSVERYILNHGLDVSKNQVAILTKKIQDKAIAAYSNNNQFKHNVKSGNGKEYLLSKMLAWVENEFKNNFKTVKK